MAFPARPLLPLLACAMTACSTPPPPLKIVVARGAVGSRCYVATPTPDSADQQLGGASFDNGTLKIATVRLSVRAHDAGDATGRFVCDRVLNVPKDVPSLRIPKMSAQKIDIYAEAFAPLAPGDTVPQRVAVGALIGVSLASKTPLPNLRLYPDERFRCVDQKMNRPRAFHTATLLPDGELLVVGGLTPSPDASMEAFGMAPLYITPDVEVFDPSTSQFVTVNESGDMPAPRAFHSAAFVGTTSDGRYQVLLVGGATADPSQPAFGLNTGAAPGLRLVPFDTSVFPIAPLPVAAAPTELLTYNPADHSVTRTPMVPFTPAIYQASASLGDGIVVAGGVDWMGQPLQQNVPAVKRIEVSHAMETPRGSADLYMRMGATLTPLPNDTALLWGGQITPTDPAGEYVVGLASGGTVKSTAIPLPMAPPTEFHTATLLPNETGAPTSSIFVAGGFLATNIMQQALQPPAPASALRQLTVTSTGMVTQTLPMLTSDYPIDTTCMNPMRFRPAGWQSATDLGRGRVLVAGGAPTLTGMCNDCDDLGTDYRCATGTASLYSASTVAPTREHMQIARYGHTATLMHDGNVLIVGGVTSAAGAPRLLRDAEVYDPRPIVPVFDMTTGMPDPDDPIAPDLSAMSTARVPGQSLSAQTLCPEL